MSLDIYFSQVHETTVHEQNITHNLNKMADAAGFYKALWRPDEHGITKAKELLPFLEKGLEDMKSNPEKYKPLSASNGWGTYEQFIPWIERLIEACKEYPESNITVSR